MDSELDTVKGESLMAPKKRSTSRSGKRTSKPAYISHKNFLAPMASSVEGQDLPFLGNPRAVNVVLFCAKTAPANLFNTLDQLGENGLAFQQCVYGGMNSLGYTMAVDDIPDAPTTTLISVVDVIQNAKKA
jgi:hypothetical protein